MDVLADTNVILRRLHRAHPQHRRTRAAITKLSRDGYRVVVTSQNLMEVWAVCTRPEASNGFGLTPTQADKVVARIEGALVRLPDTDALYPEWRRLVANLGICGKKTHDARLVAAMKVHGVEHVLTFDADFLRYPGITVLNPAGMDV